MTRATIKEFPNYEASDDGRIYSRISSRFLTPSPNTRGYPKVGLRKEGKSYTRSVHGLVARTFLPGYQEGLEPNHIDANKNNSRVSNLEWTTRLENMQHASRMGLIRNNNANNKAIRIVETGEVFDSVSACARYVGGHPSNIVKVINGKLRHHKGFTYEFI